MSEHSDAYRGVHEHVTALVGSTAEDSFDLPVPATPEWRLCEVLAHMVGVADDVLAGRLDGVATDAWTAAQVDPRRGRSVPDLLVEWDELGPRLEVQIDPLPAVIVGQLVFDVVTHEHDLRQALDAPGARESDGVVLAFDWVRPGRTKAGLPAIRYEFEGDEYVSGTGAVVGALRGTRFDLIRAFTGRRTADEIAGMGFAGPPETVLVADFFSLTASSLGE